MGSTGVYSMRNNVRCFDNLAKLHLMVSKSLLTQEIWLRLGFIQCIFRGEGSGEREEFLPLLTFQCAITLDAGWALHFNQCMTIHNSQLALDTGGVACGEKLNRSLCSLKIKLFLDAGGGDWGLFNAQ